MKSSVASDDATSLHKRHKKTWFVVRVSILLVLLLGVLLYAYNDVTRRRARNEFDRTLMVALVLVEHGDVAPEALQALRSRVWHLEARLYQQFRRFRKLAVKPFAFVVYGPAKLRVPLPEAPDSSWLALLRHALELRSFASDVDSQIDLPSRGFDARIYVVVTPPGPENRGLVEGLSEHGGWIGVARSEFDAENVDITLFVAAHELLHLLGATDRYDAMGRTLIPEGLAEPELRPRFPQKYAEIMARNRPISPDNEVRPSSLDELWVGQLTAAELGLVD